MLFIMSANGHDNDDAEPTLRRGLCPPSHAGAKLCVLDLDNTLIDTKSYAMHDYPDDSHHLETIPGFTTHRSRRVVARPGAVDLLQSLDAVCDVALWTASEK